MCVPALHRPASAAAVLESIIQMVLKRSIGMAVVLCLVGVAYGADRRASITRGVDSIYGAMNASGNWEVVTEPEPFKPGDNVAMVTHSNFSGRTALALYALLSCGEKAVDPRLERAIALLKKTPPPPGTYALSFRCLALASLPQTPEIRTALIRDSKALLANATPQGVASYVRRAREQPDLSNSQIMLFGLAAARERGVEVPDRLFSAAEDAWHGSQRAEGAWGYAPLQKQNPVLTDPHPGMTAAGVATLLLIADAHASAAGPRDRLDPHLEKAMRWLSDNFDRFFGFDLFGDRSLYCLYALERAGVAGGVKRFGQVPWFERGTTFLESRQNQAGAWTVGVDGSTDATVCTAFALLFLCHVDAPAALNKLRYRATDDDDASPSWNGRHRDVSRLTSWMANQTEQKLRWQVVDLRTPDDLDDAPVLYVSGTKPPVFSDDDVVALKSYVDRGGLVVFAPEAGAKPFADAVRAVGIRLYPTCEWRALPEDHPLFVQQQFKAASWTQLPRVDGLTNGTRELMLIVDADAPRQWQAGISRPTTTLYELGANIVQYTGNPVRPIVAPPAVPAIKPKSSVSVARLSLPNEEQNAWPMLSGNFAVHADLTLDVTTIRPGDAVPGGVKLLHLPMIGAGDYRDSDVKQLRDYTDAGGTILIEAVAGTSKAVDAVDDLVRRVWPDATDVPVPDPILGVIELRRVAITDANRVRPLAMQTVGAGRLVISRVDLSGGWAGLRHGSITGMKPESATAVMKLILKP